MRMLLRNYEIIYVCKTISTYIMVKKDIVFLLSGATPNRSLGGPPSKIKLGKDIFSDVTAAQQQNGFVDYRCIYIANEGKQLLENISLSIIPGRVEIGGFVQSEVQVLTI